MHARLAVDPLLFQTAMVDPRLMPVPLQMPVGEVRPLLPPFRKLLRIAFPILGRRETVRAKRPPRHHQMRVVVPLVALLVRRVNRDIDSKALPHERLARKILHQPFALLRRQFMRQGNFNLARQLRVFPLLRPLRMVPKRVAVMRPFRRVFRREDFRELDALGARLVKLLLVRLLVPQPLAAPIRGGGNRALPLPPADNLRGQVKNRHARRFLPLSLVRRSPNGAKSDSVPEGAAILELDSCDGGGFIQRRGTVWRVRARVTK